MIHAMAIWGRDRSSSRVFVRRCRAAVLCRRKHWGGQRHERRAKFQIFPSPALARSLATLLRQRFSHAASPWASACRGVAWCKQMMQADWVCSAGGLVRLRLGQEGATAGARCLHGQDQKVCFEKNTLSATLPSSYASRPRTWWSSTMWMAHDRWQATYTGIDAMEYRPKTAGPPPPPTILRGGPGSGGRSPVRKGYGSRPTSQTRKQAAVTPEAPVPGMQQGKRFRCTCRCTIPNAPPRAPRRPSGRWRSWSLQCRPLPGPGWPAIDITEQMGRRLRACAATKVEDLIWGADDKRLERRRKKPKQLFEAWKLLWAGHIYAKVQHATMTRCNMATWLMHCSRHMEALRLGRDEKMTRRGQGSGVEGDAPGPKSLVWSNTSIFGHEIPTGERGVAQSTCWTCPVLSSQIYLNIYQPNSIHISISIHLYANLFIMIYLFV